MKIDLNSLIPDKLMWLVTAWFNGESIEYVIKGGRASSKTQVACYLLIIPVLMGWGNCVCVRRYRTTLRSSCFNALRNAINFLGLGDSFKFINNSLEIRCKLNGYVISFVGLDDPEKTKGFVFPNGKGCYAVWYEEANTIDSYKDIRSIHQTFSRNGSEIDGLCRALMTYNPPNSKTEWSNKELPQMIPHPTDSNKMYRIFEHINYLDIPREWLSDAFFVQAEVLKNTREEAYRHEYLGEVVSMGGNLFPNVKIITPDIESSIDKSFIHRGVDFGFRDAMVSMQGVYSEANRSIYIIDGFYKRGSSYNELSDWLKATNKWGNSIYCDCADTGGIQQLRDNGVLGAVACYKPNDSIQIGIRWMQHLDNIYVAPHLVEIYTYLAECQYQKNKEGEFTNEYPKSKDPCWDVIDCVRYTFEQVIYNRW